MHIHRHKPTLNNGTKAFKELIIFAKHLKGIVFMQVFVSFSTQFRVLFPLRNLFAESAFDSDLWNPPIISICGFRLRIPYSVSGFYSLLFFVHKVNKLAGEKFSSGT